MPPSPSLRHSPRGGPRGDNDKRGQSFEKGLSFKEIDDDLALFKEMQSRERGNFLLESTDDFEELLSSRSKPFSDFKLGINIPARGEGSDLLNSDGDKNDYEWLLTPPDTPLFPSLDDEPAPVNPVHSGRARTRPISISRSSSMEKSHRSSRGSPSPQRLSPSPQSGTNTFHGRPSSAPHSNRGPLHSNSPSRRPSPPPVKHSTPSPRSLTPNSRRMTGMSGTRGTSPVRTSRGNSVSPKVRAWQSNIPGFSLEAPPNLRTSLADRPASYVRGSSPASRTSRDSSLKFGRQSMSPTPSRSISSSHSQDRDRLSSYSKGSIVSSGDDDADSLMSVPRSVSDRPTLRQGFSGFSNGRPLGFSKKPMKTFSSSSAPKRSLDSVIRQMDRKTPPNMFRPLLSSVPNSTFYSGKPNTANPTLISRNSSVTTSSNASSDRATSAALDTEGSDQYHDDMASDCARPASSDIHEEIFVFDKAEVGPEKTELESHNDSSEAKPATGQSVQGDVVIVDCHDNTLICSICGSRCRPDDPAKSEDNICFECKKEEESHVIQTIPSIPQLESSIGDSQSRDVSEIARSQDYQSQASHHDGQHSQSNMENSLPVTLELETMDVTSKQQVTRDHRTSDGPSDISNCGSDMNINVAEGTGISVLLNRCSSVKGSIVHGRTIDSSAISFEDLSYARDLTSSLRGSVGHGSFSASSSIDLTSARHGEMFVRRQLSCKLSDTNSKPQSTVSSLSGTSLPVYQGVGLSTRSHEGSNTLTSDQVVPSENGEFHNTEPSISTAPITDVENYDNSMSSLDKNPSFIAGSMSSTEVENVLNEADEDRQHEDGTISENRVPGVGVVEDSRQCSSSTMSVIEIDDSHPSSPRSLVDDVIREDLDSLDANPAMHHDKDGKDVPPESDQPDMIVGESTFTLEDKGGQKTRNMTLEEATDTILFCSSIIHDLAYKAANTAIEKEKENLEPFEGSRPTVTIPDKSSSDSKGPRGFTSGRTPKTQEARKKRTTETEVKPPLTQNDKKSNEPMVRPIGLPNDEYSLKPTKLESKCNCTIM